MKITKSTDNTKNINLVEEDYLKLKGLQNKINIKLDLMVDEYYSYDKNDDTRLDNILLDIENNINELLNVIAPNVPSEPVIQSPVKQKTKRIENKNKIITTSKVPEIVSPPEIIDKKSKIKKVRFQED